MRKTKVEALAVGAQATVEYRSNEGKNIAVQRHRDANFWNEFVLTKTDRPLEQPVTDLSCLAARTSPRGLFSFSANEES